MEFALCVFFKLPDLNLDQYSLSSSLKMLMSFGIMGQRTQTYGIRSTILNFSTTHSDSYEIHGDIRVHSSQATILVAPSPHVSGNMSLSWFIRPYARKLTNTIIQPVRDWTVLAPLGKNDDQFPVCDRVFDVPAVLFSSGGFSPNYFHSFADILIPLYQTIRQYNTNVIFLITNYQTWWENKHKPILEKLTKYEIVDIDNANQVLCFSKAIIGLRKNKELGIARYEPPYHSMKDFRRFLRSAYSLKRDTVKCGGKNKKPRMLMVSREKTRRLINEYEIAGVATKLGFEVEIREVGWNVPLAALIVNSVDVFVGVHGAGLTNMVYLPENAIVIQIVPFGLEHPSRELFGYPSQGMNFTYIEYKVNLNESSLNGKYPPDSQVYTDPFAIYHIGWRNARDIFFDGQNMKIDLARFRDTLLKAFQLCTTLN